MRRSFLVLSCALGFMVVSVPARAVPLLDTFGGPVGYGTNTLPANDDGSSSAIPLAPAFPGGLNFFGGPYTDAYVNNNGNVTFNGPQYNYTPEPFPIADRPMIAPYWGDVDTRGEPPPMNNAVFWHLEPGRMVVTWHNVGYYYISDDRKMDFQMIVTNALDCRAGDFDVEFRYNRCEWTTGDASGGSGGLGGTPAQAGFDAGNLTDFVEIPGSRTMAILDLCTTSNVGMPGIWRFSVRGGEVSCPGTGDACDTGMPGACGVGVTQCVGRDTECRQIGTVTEERCDGVDNDCNAMIDDGDLCAEPNVCIAGECRPPCFEGGCAAAETCTSSGACIETVCLDVPCPPGERCSGGVCVGACEGIVCPHGQQCIAGRCTDLCDVLTCAMGEVCVDGSCVPQCPCRACADDETCLADGSCIPTGCDIVICEEGYYCDAGECFDACAGAVCPQGQHCELGDCVEGAPPVDGGVPGGDSGVPGVDSGPPVLADAGTLDAGGGGGGGRSRSGGCGCRVAEPQPATPWLVLLAPFVAAWRRRRRR
jgi:MYXO-CTERM domain-containing protein